MRVFLHEIDAISKKSKGENTSYQSNLNEADFVRTSMKIDNLRGQGIGNNEQNMSNLGSKRKDKLYNLKYKLHYACEQLEGLAANSCNRLIENSNRSGSVDSLVLLCDVSDSDNNDSDCEHDGGSPTRGGSPSSLRKKKRLLMVAPTQSSCSRVVRFHSDHELNGKNTKVNQTQSINISSGVISESLLSRKCVSTAALNNAESFSHSADGVTSCQPHLPFTSLPLLSLPSNFCLNQVSASSSTNASSPPISPVNLIKSSSPNNNINNSNIFGAIVSSGCISELASVTEMTSALQPHVQIVHHIWSLWRHTLAVHQRAVLAKAARALRSSSLLAISSFLKTDNLATPLTTTTHELRTNVLSDILQVACTTAVEICGGAVSRVIILLADPLNKEFKLVADKTGYLSTKSPAIPQIRVDLAGAAAEKIQPILWHAGLTKVSVGDATNALTIPLLGGDSEPNDVVGVIQFLDAWPAATCDMRRAASILASMTQAAVCQVLLSINNNNRQHNNVGNKHVTVNSSTFEKVDSNTLPINVNNKTDNKFTYNNNNSNNNVVNHHIIPSSQTPVAKEGNTSLVLPSDEDNNKINLNHDFIDDSKINENSALRSNSLRMNKKATGIRAFNLTNDNDDDEHDDNLQGDDRDRTVERKFESDESKEHNCILSSPEINNSDSNSNRFGKNGRHTVAADFGNENHRISQLTPGRSASYSLFAKNNHSGGGNLIGSGMMVDLQTIEGLVTNNSCDSKCCEPLRHSFASVRHRSRSVYSTGRLNLHEAAQVMSSCAMLESPDESLLMLFDDSTYSHQLAMHAQHSINDLLGSDSNPNGVRLIIPPLDSEPIPEYVNNPNALLDWDFNPFTVSQAALVKLTVEYLRSTPKLSVLPEERIRGLVQSCRELYFDNFYHGFTHGVCVTGVVGLLLKQTGAGRAITDDEAGAALLGALMHDVGHPGTNNEYSVKRGARVALTFVSSGVLESLHASIATELVAGHGILDSLGKSSAAAFRQSMVTAILATDMTRHAQLNEFLSKSGIESALFPSDSCASETHLSPADGENIASKLTPAMRELTVQHLVKAGDLSNPVLKTDLCVEWARRICLEFALQARSERELGLEPNPMLCVDPRNVRELAQNQKNFIIFLVKPYWSNLYKNFGGLKDRMDQVDANINYWDHEIQRGKAIEEEAAAILAAKNGDEEKI